MKKFWTISFAVFCVGFSCWFCAAEDDARQLFIGPGDKHFKAWGPPQPAVEEFKIYSESEVKVFRDGQQISTTLTQDGHYPYITANVVAFGQTFVLKMLKNRYLLSNVYTEKTVTPQGETYINATDIFNHCYYTGTVNDQEPATAAISTCNGVVGYFEYGNDTYDIEPLQGTVAGRHRVYRDSDSVLPPGQCGHTGGHGNAESRNPRKKRSFNWPMDLDGQTKVVELYIANDYTQYVAMGSNVDTVITRTKTIVNIASTMYQPLGIYLVLVGVEVWTNGSMINVSMSNHTATLEAFKKYRAIYINPRHPNDNAHLLFGNNVIFPAGVVGSAYLMAMCSYDASAAFVCDRAVMPGQAGVVLAHEMGHSLGFLHDDAIGACACDDPAGYCIMLSSVRNTLPSKWSQCSKDLLAVSFSRSLDYCLDNIPDTLYDAAPVCGNGIVETGEQCDCGNSTTSVCNSACCDRVTCRLVGSATCAAGRCCNLTTCQLKPLTTICRPARESCDLVEYCSGNDAVCPSDVYRQDGTACTVNGVGAYCYQGRCNTHESQCQLWYGQTAHNGVSACYSTFNVLGDIRGYCGYNSSTDVYQPCTLSNAACGLLHCDINVTTGSTLNLMNFDISYPIFDYLEYSDHTLAYVCSYAYYNAANYGTQRLSPNLVPNGAACGTDKMCLSQKCVNVADLSVLRCPDCHQHGVCNNLGECHCDAGYAPPDCSEHGGGGSNHSNPIVLYEPPTVITTTRLSTITTYPAAMTSLSSGTTSPADVTSSSPITTSSAAATSLSSMTTGSTTRQSSSLTTTTSPPPPPPARTRPRMCALKKWRKRHPALCR